MSRKKKYHYPNFEATLRKYADSRDMELVRYSEYHYRLMDGGFTILDMWDTGKYYVLLTSYNEIASGTIERQGETGSLPMKKLVGFLDKLFFPLDA